MNDIGQRSSHGVQPPVNDGAIERAAGDGDGGSGEEVAAVELGHFVLPREGSDSFRSLTQPG